jgi:alkanesulfonate monooxygenase SsuD/methylene tetrahydromethanopterin reductase-like flavin-dependent oxidoreductase (luciferase family)
MAITFGVALDFGSKLRPLNAQLARQSELLHRAEEAGFELVAAGESSAPAGFHLPDALQVLAAICLHTRLRLCTGIALLPAWQPWKLALDAAQLDQLSGGRVVLGVGLGSAALQARAGWPADAIGETADETLAALRALWSGANEYRGAHVAVNAGLPVQPVSIGGPPIWVGGTIRRSAVRAARYGQAWYAGINFRLSHFPTNVAWYRQALAAEGKRPDAVNVVVNRLALAAETPAAVADLIDRYLAGTLHAYARGESLQQVIDDVALVGTPPQIVAQVDRYRASGVTHLFARLSLDDMPSDVATHTIELFGREVIPRFGV